MAGILAVFGTRPEIIKLSPVVAVLRARGAPIRTCFTGQHQTMAECHWSAVDLTPDKVLTLGNSDRSLNALLSRLLTQLSEVMEVERPHRVLVQGDTTSAVAAAIAAHHLQIPVAHVEAGLRSGDNRQPWPEEFNRRAISAIADLHFVPTQRAKDALLTEGHAPASVVMTGNTVIDALFAMRRRLAETPRLGAEVEPVLAAAAGRRLILVTLHRRESLGAGLAETAAAIRGLAARNDVHFVLPLHANPEIADGFRSSLDGAPNVDLVPHLAYPAFVQLLSHCHVVLTDSGGVQEEAPAIGKPVLVLRDVTERPESVDAGTARLVGTRAQRIMRETCRLLDNPQLYARMARPHILFGDGHAAERIANALTHPAEAMATR